MWNQEEKAQLKIFFIVNFGLVVIMGIIMGIASSADRNVEVLGQVQMMYPIMGVIAAIWFTKRNDKRVPKNFFLSILLFSTIIILLAFLEVFIPVIHWDNILVGICIVGAIVLFLSFAIEDNEKKQAYRLINQNESDYGVVKYSVLFIITDILYYIVILLVCYALGEEGSLAVIKSFIFNLPRIFLFAINFAVSFIFYIGEEYGWRCFLQPLMQKKFGMRKGVLLVGVIWGIWHLPVSMFIYNPDAWLLQMVQQVGTCIALGIFLGYVYLKTKTVWAVAIIHGINNGMTELLERGDIKLSPLILYTVFTIVCLIIYVPFLKSKVFDNKEVLEELKL